MARSIQSQFTSPQSESVRFGADHTRFTGSQIVHPGDKKKTRIKLNEVTESDYKVLQSLNSFSSARRIKVITLETTKTKEDVLELAAREFRSGAPFILRPKRRAFFKVMEVSRTPLDL